MLHSNILTQWPAQDRDFRCVFIGAGFLWELPLLVESVMHVILDRRAKSPEAVVSDNILAEVISQGRHR